MIEIKIPGYKTLSLEHCVLDYNGTLACDGELIPGVKELLNRLAESLQIHVVTADTFGKAAQGLKDITCKLVVLPVENQAEGKLEFIKNLSLETVVSFGNGRNDRMMLRASALGIAVILNEGAAKDTLMFADVVCTSIISALELLCNPLRLVATLR